MSKQLKDYPNISLLPEAIGSSLDFNDLFGRSSPVHFEIGSGKATFLVNEAANHPENNYFGIEWCSKVYRYAVDRIGRHGFTNVRIIRTDAAVLIKENVPDQSIDTFHIYFPDPWPKKRHNKRRFICETNVQQLLRCLKPGGVIKVATDHADYFEQIQKVLSIEAFEIIEFFPTSGAQSDKGEWAGTNFERKYLKEGRVIYTIAVRKR